MTPENNTQTAPSQIAQQAPGQVQVITQPQQAMERRTLEPIAIGDRGLQLESFDALWRFCGILFKSGFAPKDCKGPESLFIAIQMGMECGLSIMSSVQNVAAVNGRPAIWGDAQLGIVRSSGLLESYETYWEVDGNRIDRLPPTLPDGLTAVCVVKRVREKSITATFSVTDARRAGLWDKEGTWRTYPQRMLMNRARSFALRDAFGDVLKGFKSFEEAGEVVDLPAESVTVETQTGPLPVAAPRRGRPPGPAAHISAHSTPPTVGTTPADTSAHVAPTAPPFKTVSIAPQPPQDSAQTTAPAPVQSAPTHVAPPPTTPAPVEVLSEPAPNPNATELRRIIQADGFSFAAVKEAVAMLKWVDTSNWTSWESIDEGIARRMLGAKNGLIREMKSIEAKKTAAAIAAAPVA